MSLWLKKALLFWAYMIAIAGAMAFVMPRSQAQPDLMGRVLRTNCLYNMRDLGLALRLYYSDYDEFYPQARTWDTAFRPEGRYAYAKDELFDCPAIPKGRHFGYAFNSKLSGKEGRVVINPAKMVVFYETSNLNRNAFGLGKDVTYRHMGGAVYEFADGHTKWFPKGQTPSFNLKMK